MTNQETDSLTIAPDGRPHDEQPRWRKDFPVDWPEDHYVARRDFVKFLTLTSMAFAVGQIWILLKALWRRMTGRPAPARIASADALARGSAMTFQFPTKADDAVLVRLDDGSLVAYGQKCTHLSCAVVPRPDRGMIHCPCHEGWFDLKTGRPLAGPPRRPLDRIDLEERDGAIWAVDVERRTQ